jgi:putative PIN family toxin of toxin-antitoxin system
LRAVLDVNVLISAALSPRGAPARVLRAWQAGSFDLVVSDHLLDELARALAYPKISRHVNAADAVSLVAWLSREAVHVDDPRGEPPFRSVDPGDDYLIALAAEADAVLVSGDAHLLELREQLPIYAPADFLSLLDAEEERADLVRLMLRQPSPL